MIKSRRPDPFIAHIFYLSNIFDILSIGQYFFSQIELERRLSNYQNSCSIPYQERNEILPILNQETIQD